MNNELQNGMAEAKNLNQKIDLLRKVFIFVRKLK